jgi:Transposase
MAEPKKVYRLNKKNGITYIYLDEPYWDKETKVSRHRMKGIGKVGPDGEDVYNEYYLNLAKENREVVSISETVRLGERNVCENAAKRTGVRSVLNKVFGKEDAEKMLCLAYYEICEGKAFAYAEDWAKERGWDMDLSSQAVSRFLDSVRENRIDEFFKVWMEMNSEKKSLLFDITSVSSYDRNNAYTERGHNRDNENLEQINIGLLSAYGSLVPMWYALLPGSVSDVTVMDYLAARLSKLGQERIVITSDRGFYSDGNLKHLVSMNYKFTIPVPSSVLWQKELIGENIDKLYSPEHIIHLDDNTFIYGKTFCDNSSPYGRVWKHLYFDPERKQREIKNFMSRLEKCRAELEDGVLIERNKKFYESYFLVKETPKRGRKVDVNGKAVNDFLNGASCYWVLLSNTEKDAATALSHYRMRNDIELQFDDLKNSIDCNRLRTHSESTMKGKIFICFLSLIVLNELKKEVSAIPPQDRKYWNWKEILAKVSTYGKCKFTNKYKDVYTVPTKAQRMLFRALKIDYVWKGEKVSFDTAIEDEEPQVLDD